MKQQLEQRFEIKIKVIGFGDEEVGEERICNGIFRVTKEGLTMEADQNYADIIIESLNLKGAKALSSQCEGERRCEDENRTVLDDKTQPKVL